MPIVDTYGFDLKQVIADAKENGNEAFAQLCEEKLAEFEKAKEQLAELDKVGEVAEKAKENLQELYKVVAQKWTTTGKDAWDIDAEYAKGLMK